MGGKGKIAIQEKVKEEVRDELEEMKEKYVAPRRKEIKKAVQELLPQVPKELIQPLDWWQLYSIHADVLKYGRKAESMAMKYIPGYDPAKMRAEKEKAEAANRKREAEKARLAAERLRRAEEKKRLAEEKTQRAREKAERLAARAREKAERAAARAREKAEREKERVRRKSGGAV